jgi:D-3-phosphoglycerate dehydrogenase
MRCLVLQPIDEAGLSVLERAGLTVERWPSPSTLDDLGSVDAIITRNAPVGAGMIAAAPGLRVIGSHGSGVNAIDVAAATRAGVVVVNTPGANARAVAEHALMLMLAVARRLPQADAATRRGHDAFKFEERFSDLQGRRLGLVGWGHTARALARIAAPVLGAPIRVWSRTPPGPDAGVQPVATLGELLRDADVLSLHLPVTGETRGVIGRAELASMPDQAILVNVARGGLVDEAALVAALDEGRLFGAGLDVLAREEGAETPEALVGHPRVVLTPHIAGSSRQALRDTSLAVCGQVLDVLQGRRPAHPVNAA